MDIYESDRRDARARATDAALGRSAIPESPESPKHNPDAGCYVAVNELTGAEVYGPTWGTCAANLRESLRVARRHRELWAWECDCTLPSQSCPACREAARMVHGDDYA